jgi:gliding motility-associated-like protein
MKRFLLFFTLILNALLAVAQFSANGTHKIYTEINGQKLNGIDYLFVFDGISSQTEIEYTANSSSIKWSKFTSPTTPIVLQYDSINSNIEDATGYIVEIDGAKKYIWVIDYKNYIPIFTSLIPEDKPKEQCDELILNLNHSVLPLQYKTPLNTTVLINRTFQLKYATKEWSESTKAWTDKEMSVDYKLPATTLTVLEPPLCDTKFKLVGDNFATELGLTPFEIESPLYSAVKVECHIVSTASTRTELNEDDRPEKADITTASAPIEIVFASNANIPVAEFYAWQIFKDKSLLFTRNDQDLRFTFTEAGTYNVKLTTSNTNNCQYSDSITIKVVESRLEVPGVFTPNGDGINDEFRVAYKSIVEFRCWVFNRWQQKVFYWTDPQKGWDGKINGKPATQGAYFYVIEALGADGVNHNTKGNINLLRGKKD